MKDELMKLPLSELRLIMLRGIYEYKQAPFSMEINTKVGNKHESKNHANLLDFRTCVEQQ